jgi:hypothetical protein
MIGFLLAQVVKLTAAIAVPTVSALAIKYWSKQWNLDVSEKQYDALVTLSRSAVMAAEQQHAHVQDREERRRAKRATAVDFVVQNARKRDIDVDEKSAGELVEAAVLQYVNAGQPGSSSQKTTSES